MFKDSKHNRRFRKLVALGAAALAFGPLGAALTPVTAHADVQIVPIGDTAKVTRASSGAVWVYGGNRNNDISASLSSDRTTYTIRDTSQHLYLFAGTQFCSVVDTNTVTCAAIGSAPLTIDGNDGNDVIRGTDASDVILGGNGNDQIYGNGGNDNIQGNPGADLLNGGPGDDQLVGRGWTLHSDADLSPDTFWGGAGTDWVTYSAKTAGVTVTLDDVPNDGRPGEYDNVHSDVERLTGTDYADVLTGSAAGNVIWGAMGDDTIHGGGGPDYLLGESGRDSLYGDAGNDYLEARFYPANNYPDGDAVIDCGTDLSDTAVLDFHDPNSTACETSTRS